MLYLSNVLWWLLSIIVWNNMNDFKIIATRIYLFGWNVTTLDIQYNKYDESKDGSNFYHCKINCRNIIPRMHFYHLLQMTIPIIFISSLFGCTFCKDNSIINKINQTLHFYLSRCLLWISVTYYFCFYRYKQIHTIIDMLNKF